MNRTWVAVFALGLACIAAPSASAHAILTDSNPKMLSTISNAPEQIWLEFDGNLIEFPEKNSNFLNVTDSKGRSITKGKSFVGGARLSVKIKSGLMKGRYGVAWRVVSDDGHVVKGSSYFILR